jgi:2-keto-4-pentenoate hydratase/2-oxohepta-3-ene-1,7-dioic acid hydratase in catechol pathway
MNPSKIVCVGRNYQAHAAELGNDVPAEPLIFLKPPSALIPAGSPILLPPGAGRVDFEGEIALEIGMRARRVAASVWRDYVRAVLPANDVTARDLQRADSQWTRAKGFDTFCPVGEPGPLEEVDLDALAVVTRVNGEERQRARADQMAFPIPVLVEYISGIMTLEPGDLVLTGTPEGIGPLRTGDTVEVVIPGVGTLINPVEDG